MDTLKGSGGGGVDPTMMYMLMQSKQDADQAEAERKQCSRTRRIIKLLRLGRTFG